MVLPILLLGSLHPANKFGDEKVLITFDPSQNRNLVYQSKMNMDADDLYSIRGGFQFRFSYRQMSQNQYALCRSASRVSVGVYSLNATPIEFRFGQNSNEVSKRRMPIWWVRDHIEGEAKMFREMPLYDAGWVTDLHGNTGTAEDGKQIYNCPPVVLGSLYDLVYPSLPVGVGDTWVREFPQIGNLMGGFLQHRKVAFTLVSRNAKVAQISAKISDGADFLNIVPNVYWVEISTGCCLSASGRTKILSGPIEYTLGFEEKLISRW